METKDADGQGDGDGDGDEAEDDDEVDGDRRDEAKVEVGDEVLCARLPQSAGNSDWGEVRVAGREERGSTRYWGLKVVHYFYQSVIVIMIMQPACNNYENILTHSANDKAQAKQKKGEGGGQRLRDQLIFQLDIFSI